MLLFCSQIYDETITFIDNNEFNIIKTINKIPYDTQKNNNNNCFILFKNYIILKFKDLIGLLFIKTKEIVQLEIFNDYILVEDNENIYFLILKDKNENNDIYDIDYMK